MPALLPVSTTVSTVCTIQAWVAASSFGKALATICSGIFTGAAASGSGSLESGSESLLGDEDGPDCDDIAAATSAASRLPYWPIRLCTTLSISAPLIPSAAAILPVSRIPSTAAARFP
ncbi:MAG TPA: hypothetical protein QGG37_02185 [Chloroflexota bacterium]|nr:hypothetical protein [Chloroflexota bacterium]